LSPVGKTYNLTVNGTPAATSAITAGCFVFQVCSSVPCRIRVGEVGTVAAVTDYMLPAFCPMCFHIPEGNILSVIAESGGDAGLCSVGEMY
jgi:hypothetical protein